MENKTLQYVSGTIYAYSFLCMRKVWLFHHNISMEHESELVAIGKFIDENTYVREKHGLMIDGKVNIDFLKNNIVHEIKKSGREKDMAVNQIKYYLFILKEHGFKNIKGCLNIPSVKHKEEVLLEKEDIENIKKRLKIICEITEKKNIPEVINKGSCKKCAYYELCYI